MNPRAINTSFRLTWAALRAVALGSTLFASSMLATGQERGTVSPVAVRSAATEQGAEQPVLRSVVRVGITVGERAACSLDFSGKSRCCQPAEALAGSDPEGNAVVVITDSSH